MIKKRAYAKLNLNLHLLPQKDKKGYYPVRFINTQLDLYDELSFEPLSDGAEVICSDKEMPRQKENLVYKAILMLQRMDSQKRGVRVIINKNIPVRAGLGGGSADAAVAINTLSSLWKINLSDNKKANLADSLGKDVHYQLLGEVAEVSGDGSRVIPLFFELPKFWLVILVPKETKPSTGWMYEHIDKTKTGKHIHLLPEMKKAIELKNKKDFLNCIFNDFELSVFKHFPVTLDMKKDLERSGALKTLLCGSGLSVAGFFNTEDDADHARKILINKYKSVIISKLK